MMAGRFHILVNETWLAPGKLLKDISFEYQSFFPSRRNFIENRNCSTWN